MSSPTGGDDTARPGPRLLLVAPQPFFEARGTPINVLHLCRALTGAGYRVDLATYPVGQPVEMEGLEIHRCLRPPGIRSVPIGFSKRKLVLDFFLFWTLLRLLLSRRYEMVHAIEESVFMALPATLLGKRLIYDLDSIISDQLHYTGVVRSRLLLTAIRRLERLALRRSTAAVTVCRSLTEAAHTLDPDVRVFQIEDAPLEDSLRPPEPSRVEALRSEFGLHGTRSIVYTGNLESYQGLDLLLAAAPRVAERAPDARFLIVGGGGERLAALRRQLAEDGLDQWVVAVGQRPSDEMPEWMALANALVSPRSEGENTPLKIYTYMHSGRPIVATDRLTHTQVLDPGSAFLAEPSAEAMAAALLEALEEPENAALRAAAARRIANEQYSWPTFRRKVLDAYRELLGTSR